jgi:hypothetical protein
MKPSSPQSADLDVSLDIEERLYWVHLNARMSLVACSFAIWVFERLWDGTHLRKALAEEYGTDDLEAEVVQIYCWAARGTSVVTDDVDYQSVYVPHEIAGRSADMVPYSLRRLLPEGTTRSQYERLQRAMLQDLEYRLFRSWNQTSEWLDVQWARTSNLDECVQQNDLLEAFHTIVGLVGAPPGAQEVIQEEPEGGNKSDKEKVDIIDV